MRLMLWRWKKAAEQDLLMWVFIVSSESNQDPKLRTHIVGKTVASPIIILEILIFFNCFNSSFSFNCFNSSPSFCPARWRQTSLASDIWKKSTFSNVILQRTKLFKLRIKNYLKKNLNCEMARLTEFTRNTSVPCTTVTHKWIQRVNTGTSIIAGTAEAFHKIWRDKEMKHSKKVLQSKWQVMAERLRASDSSSGVSDQRSVGSNPGRDTCVLKQDT